MKNVPTLLALILAGVSFGQTPDPQHPAPPPGTPGVPPTPSVPPDKTQIPDLCRDRPDLPQCKKP